MHKRLPEFKEANGIAAQFFEQMEGMRRIWSLFVAPTPLKRGDMFLLVVIRQLNGENKQATVSALARHMHQTPSGISQKVDGLEKMEMVRREMNKSDRRVVTVQLTPKGEDITAKAWQSFFQNVERAMESLGEEKVQTLLQLQQELYAAIAREQQKIIDGEGEKQV